MTIEQAISDPKINVFDITYDKRSSFGVSVYTYPKPGESEDDYYERDNRNFQKVLQLKTKKG